MESLRSVIKTYFPNEFIEREVKVKLEDNFLLKDNGKFLMGKDSISMAVLYSDKSLPFVETDKKLFFDKRGFPPIGWRKVYSRPFDIILSIIIVLFGVYIFINFPIGLKILGLITFSFVFIYIFKMYSSLSYITVFEKSWFTGVQKNGASYEIKGEITPGISFTPQGVPFSLLVSKDKVSILPLIDKFFSGNLPFFKTLMKLQQNMPQFISRKFVLHYQET